MPEEKELVEGKIGTVGEYELKFEAGKLVGTVGIGHEGSEGVGVTATVEITIDSGKVIDAIEAAIPGKLDDAVLEILRKYLAPVAPPAA